jgi:hypothetical protein
MRGVIKMKFILLLRNNGELMVKIVDGASETLYRGAGQRVKIEASKESGTRIIDATDVLHSREHEAKDDISKLEDHNQPGLTFVAKQALVNFEQLNQFKFSIFQQLSQDVHTVTWRGISSSIFNQACKAALAPKEHKAVVGYSYIPAEPVAPVSVAAAPVLPAAVSPAPAANESSVTSNRMFTEWANRKQRERATRQADADQGTELADFSGYRK